MVMDRETKIKIVKRTAIISAIFLIFTSVLMLINYFQLTFNDPIESETMKVLIEKLNQEPGNEELIGEIRSFDLIARKAFFTSKWQIETGGLLMILSALILITSLRILSKETSRIEKPEESGLRENAIRIKSSKWILGAGISFLVLTLIASILTINHIDNYKPENNTAVITNEENENVEVVDLTATEQKDTILTDSSSNIKEDTTEVQEVEKKEIKNIAALSDIKKQSNSFRGPLGQGVFPAKNIPSSWDVAAGTNVVWKTKLPKKGYNSPVIWNDKIFVTGADASERVLYCVSLSGGNILWSQSASGIEGSPAVPPKTTDDTGLAAPSVTTDGNIVVAIFGTGDIIACDFSGNRIWAKNLGVPANHYGHSSSLIYWNGSVIVQYDSNKGGRLISLSISDGSIKWDTKRTSRISWASPILAEINGKMQVITSAEPTVAGYDSETGAEIWKNDCMMGEVGPSPAFGDGLVFATNEYATLAAINPLSGSIVWQTNEYMPEVASPVVHNGLLFIATSYGILACYDSKTGNKHWEMDYGEGFYSSPVIADGKLFACDVKGVVHIMKASSASETVGDIAMGEKIMSTPSFSSGKILIRSTEHLYCIGSK